MSKRLNLLGKRFGNLTVIADAGTIEMWNGKYSAWHCKCDCGNEVDVITHFLVNGHKKSCGCRRSECLREIASTHKLSKTRAYKIYYGMQQRCYNPKNTAYERYGGRGIDICPEWLGEDGFLHFYEWCLSHGYREDAKGYELTIDRIDGSKGYSPDNCRWATWSEQTNNTTQNVHLEYNGETHTLAEWAKITNQTYAQIQHRYYRGLPTEVVLGFSDLPNARKLNVNGEIHTLKEWSEITGISYQVIWRRFYDEWSPEEIVGYKERIPIRDQLVYNGVSHSYKEWEDITGIKAATIRARLNRYGMDVEQALGFAPSTKPDAELHSYISTHHISKSDIAKTIGISRDTLSHWFQNGLRDDRKEKVLNAIKGIENERNSE